jgi:xanthine dehydrogenase accessory factor
LRERFAFVGGIGSRAKAARTRTRLDAKGFEPDQIAKVRMPLGVAVGARSPSEIAVAIAAEMIAWRRGIALETNERGARAAMDPAPKTLEARKSGA